jgi:hypothetical protein
VKEEAGNIVLGEFSTPSYAHCAHIFAVLGFTHAGVKYQMSLLNFGDSAQ